MPTVGWIQETTWNRHADAFPFTPDGKSEPVACPLCKRSFVDRAALSSHLGVDHPLKVPMLRIGTETGLTRFTVRDLTLLDDVEFFSTTTCGVSTNGGAETALQPKRLASHFRATGNAQYRVALRNDRALDGRQAESEVEVRVVVPDQGLIRKIDEAFQKELAVDRPTMTDVDRFLRGMPSDAAARDYAGALADYVVGMLVKEQDAAAGTVAPFDIFKNKFASARRVLVDFTTPVARAVVATIDFNLNYFVHEARTTVAQLRSGHRFFASFSASGASPANVSSADANRALIPACPIDKVTGVILSTLAQFPRTVGHQDLTAALPNFGKAPLSEYDLAKIHALKAGASVLMADKPSALNHLRQIQHDYHFGAWASIQLENLSNNE
jgi:hypothetical protein